MNAYLIKDLTKTAVEILIGYAPWMAWNMFLAIVPLCLSVLLFRSQWSKPSKHSRSLLWWCGAIAFVAFLPNAPYILTDIIHLNDAVIDYNSVWVTGFILFPLYLAFLGTGFLTYVLSLINLGHYLQQQGLGRYVTRTELLLHLLCAIGVFIGRFPRLNSWHLVTQPVRVVVTILETLRSPQAAIGILVGFVIITLLYGPGKRITLALVSFHKSRSVSVVVE
jgi:uncharacterized membrane protein